MKLAQKTALQLEKQILKAGLDGGAALGQVSELARKYSVSVAVMREAVAIAELDGMVTSRRGRGGGIFVGQSSREAAQTSLQTYLSLCSASFSQICDLRLILEGHVLDIASRRLKIEDAEALRLLSLQESGASAFDLFSSMTRALDLIYEIAGDESLTFLARTVSRAFVDRLRAGGISEEQLRQMSANVWEVRRRQLEEVIACRQSEWLAYNKQLSEIWARTSRMLGTEGGKGRDHVASVVAARPPSPLDEFVAPLKKPEAVASAIASRIREETLAPGSDLGTEQQLQAELNVGRGVFREAVRILERFDIALTSRGRDGGLRVGSQSNSNLVRSVSVELLNGYHRNPDAVHKMSLVLELSAAEKAARLRGQGYDDSLPKHRTSSDPTMSYYDRVAHSCGDQALKGLMNILGAMIAFGRNKLDDKDVARLSAAERRLRAAIVSGDVAMSRRMMIVLREITGACDPIPSQASDIF